MGDIRAQIKLNKKRLGSERYRQWLQKKLDHYGIDRIRLTAVVIVVERTLGWELERNGSLRSAHRHERPEANRPYYRLWDKDGKPTQAWVHAAELALWLKFHGFKAGHYIHSIIGHPHVRRFLNNKDRKNQIPFAVLFPSARVDTERLREFSDYYKAWRYKH